MVSGNHCSWTFSHRKQECQRYFTPSYRTIELCPGHSSDPTLADHIKVHRGSRECAVLDKPWIQDFEMYQGQIKTWFNFLTHMTAAHKGTAVSCWRGKHCSSEAISVKLWTWIPVILTIEPANMAGQSHLDFTGSGRTKLGLSTHTRTTHTQGSKGERAGIYCGLPHLQESQPFHYAFNYSDPGWEASRIHI